MEISYKTGINLSWKGKYEIYTCNVGVVVRDSRGEAVIPEDSIDELRHFLTVLDSIKASEADHGA
jgi:hypothetical protein